MKFKKKLILGISGLALLGIGLVGGSNPSIQNSVQNAENCVEIPTSHADNSNKFNLSKRVISKQFTVYQNINSTRDTGAYTATSSTATSSKLNRKVDKKVDNYLRSVNNLTDYQVHISRTGTVSSDLSNLPVDSETATITFIRK